MNCRADLLAATRATIDGFVAEAIESCTEHPAYQVVCQLAPGFEVAAEVCTGHQQLIEISLPGTRSIRKRLRTS